MAFDIGSVGKMCLMLYGAQYKVYSILSHIRTRRCRLIFNHVFHFHAISFVYPFCYVLDNILLKHSVRTRKLFDIHQWLSMGE